MGLSEFRWSRGQVGHQRRGYLMVVQLQEANDLSEIGWVVVVLTIEITNTTSGSLPFPCFAGCIELTMLEYLLYLL